MPRRLKPWIEQVGNKVIQWVQESVVLSPTDSWRQKEHNFQQTIASKKSADYYSHFFYFGNSANIE